MRHPEACCQIVWWLKTSPDWMKAIINITQFFVTQCGMHASCASLALLFPFEGCGVSERENIVLTTLRCSGLCGAVHRQPKLNTLHASCSNMPVCEFWAGIRMGKHEAGRAVFHTERTMPTVVFGFRFSCQWVGFLKVMERKELPVNVFLAMLMLIHSFSLSLWNRCRVSQQKQLQL